MSGMNRVDCCVSPCDSLASRDSEYGLSETLKAMSKREGGGGDPRSLSITPARKPASRGDTITN